MFDVSKIRAVYSGRKGCACGCRGKYTYASKFQAEASRDRGYEVTDDEVNDRTVKLIAGRVEKIVRENCADWLMSEDSLFAVDTFNDRSYTIYFCEPDEPVAPAFDY
jgi:hypothetical protein